MRKTTSVLGVVTLALSACTGTIGDMDDGPGDPPLVTDVQIVVKDGNAPQANVRVVFQNTDESLIAEATTGADGTAIAEMPNGGNLTVIRTFPPAIPPEVSRSPEVYTYVAVKPGDRLQLGSPTVDEATLASAINVLVPADAVGTVSVVTPCGSGQGTAPTVPITVRGCDSMVDFYVTDQDRSSFLKRAAYGENVDLSNEPLLGALAATVAASNVQAGDAINVDIRLVSGTFELYRSGNNRVETTPATVNLPNIRNVDQLVVTSIASERGNQMTSKREVFSASPAIVDVNVGLIPFFATPTYSPTGISWTETGPGTADFVISTMNVTRAAGGANAEYVRSIIAPHTGLSMRMPMLTGVDTIYNPAATDQIAGTSGLGAVTGGYDAARSRAFATSNVIELAPANGSAALSYSGGTPPGK